MESRKSSRPETYDIIVIGAGIAGLVAAFRLAGYGYTTAVCSNRRVAYGLQSIHPGLHERFRYFGLGDVFDNNALIPVKTRVHWGGSELDTRFKEPSLLIDRRKFDARLQHFVTNNNVPIFEDEYGFEYKRRNPGDWEVFGRTKKTQLSSKFLVIADGKLSSGFSNFVKTGRTTLALEAVGKIPGINNQVTHTGIFSSSDYWSWLAVHEQELNFNVFVDPKFIRQHHSGRAHDLIRHVASEMQLDVDYPVPEMTLLRAHNASAGYMECPIGDDFILIGSAAIRSDPLSSQGIQSAFTTAIQGMVCVNTLFDKVENLILAKQFYRTQIKHMSTRQSIMSSEHYGLAASHYETAFWKSRSSAKAHSESEDAPQPDVAKIYIFSEDTKFVTTPCISGEYIVSTTGLTHPSMEQPMLFTAGGGLDRILENFESGSTLVSAFENSKAPRAMLVEFIEIARLLIGKRVLIELEFD